MKVYALGFAFGERKGRPAVLLVQKTSPEWQAGKYNGVGGSLEPGEEPIDAMTREFLEETSINTEHEDWEYKLALQGENETIYIFKSVSVNVQLARQTTKKDKPLVCELDALPQQILPNVRWIIPFLNDPENIFGVVHYPPLKGRS